MPSRAINQDSITWQKVLQLVKEDIAASKGGGYEWKDIYVDQTLSGRHPNGLGYRRFEGLTVRLNKTFLTFDVTLTVSEVRGAGTVGALYNLIWSKIPSTLREK